MARYARGFAVLEGHGLPPRLTRQSGRDRAANGMARFARCSPRSKATASLLDSLAALASLVSPAVTARRTSRIARQRRPLSRPPHPTAERSPRPFRGLDDARCVSSTTEAEHIA